MCWPAFVRSFFDEICAENGELFQKFDFISSVYKTNIRFNTKKIAADKALVQCTHTSNQSQTSKFSKDSELFFNFENLMKNYLR